MQCHAGTNGEDVREEEDGLLLVEEATIIPACAGGGGSGGGGGGGLSRSVEMNDNEDVIDEDEIVRFRRQTPLHVRTKFVKPKTHHPKWRRSMS